MIKFIPSKLSGSIVRLVASISWPRFFVLFICNLFARKYNIDTSSLSKPVNEYKNLLDFFIREPGTGVRPVCDNPTAFVSPVDAAITAAGTASGNEIFLVKGTACSIYDITCSECPEYIGGDYIVLYLSPGDFHRIYSPCDGKVIKSTFIDGKLWPVFPDFIEKNPDTYFKNKRVITELQCKGGKILLIKIGALNVGQIPVNHELPYSGNNVKCYSKGEEVGRFEFGSSVIMILERDRYKLSSEIQIGSKVKIGEALGSILDA